MDFLRSNPNKPAVPSLEAYRQYADDLKNEGTFASTSATHVIKTAPKTFFDHTIAFIFNKTNSQEVADFHQALINHYGLHIANFVFPLAMREQAATSNLGGYAQQSLNSAVKTLINPSLERIKVGVSIPINREEPRGFLQQQLHAPIQAAIREVNPNLRNIELNLALPTDTPPVGLSHDLVQQVINQADGLVRQNASYVEKTATTTDKIANSLKQVDPNDLGLFPQGERKLLQDTIKNTRSIIDNLAKNVLYQQKMVSSSSSKSPPNDQFTSALATAETSISGTINNAYQLLHETRTLDKTLKQLKQQHEYYELGNTAPISLQKYNFEQFIPQAEELLRDAALLGQDTIEHLCSPPISADKEIRLKEYLRNNDGISRDVSTISLKISQLKQELQHEVNDLVIKAQNRYFDADQALSKPSTAQSWYDRLLFRSLKNRQEEREEAESNLEKIQAFADTIDDAIEEAENGPTENGLIWKTVPTTTKKNISKK